MLVRFFKEEFMKKLIFVFCMLLVAGVLFAGGGREAEETADGGPVTIVFSTELVPAEPAVQGMTVFKEELERLSEGTMAVNIFHSGALIAQRDHYAALMDNTVDMGITGIPWIAEFWEPIGVLGTPFNYRDAEHAYTFWNESADGKDVIETIADETNVRILGGFFFGYRQITTIEQTGPVRSPADLAGQNFRMPGTPLWLAVGEALGTNPTPVDASEAYMALQTGLVVGVDMPLNQMSSLKLYEPTRYTSLTNHLTEFLKPAINEDKWNSLNSQQQEWVMEAARAMIDFAHQGYVDAFEVDLAFLRDQGQIIIEDVDRNAFLEHSREYFTTNPEGVKFSEPWDWDLFDRVQAVQ